MGSAMIVKANGDKVILDHKPTYAEVKEAVGGYIEYTSGKDEAGKAVTIIVNEEGLLEGLPFNSIATQMMARKYGQAHLVGNAVVMHGWTATA
jgi:hypothetical protein